MEQGPPRGWWERHWKWAVPVGCLTPVVVCCGGFTLVFALVFGAIKSSEVYTHALSRAQAHDEVKDLLGEPVEARFWVTGQLQVSGSSGEADLAIPLSGPRGSATLHVVATKSAGEWQYSTLAVVPEGGGRRIDLRE